MKKRFTILMAAMMLLAMFANPMRVMGQTTYEQLTSIANIDESAQYVLGIDGTGFHYEGTSSWGKTALPSAQTPIYYTLTKATDGNSFTAHATISGTTYYLQIPTSNTFSMATSTGTNTDIIIGTTQVSGTNYAVANRTTTARHLRINGTSGLRSYAGTTGTMAFFYKVVPASGTTYTVTYDCNGGTSGCPENVTGLDDGDEIVLANGPVKTNYDFVGWSDGTDTYDESVSYTVHGDVTFTAQWQSNISALFYESFDDCDGTGGNDNQWSGSIASSTLTTDNTGWAFVKGNGANKCAKFGTGSALGSAQTPAISHTGNATLTFKAAAWNGGSESTTLKLSATSGTLSASTVTLVKGAWTDYTINITGITTSTQIKFEGNATSNSRFFLDEVMVVEAAPSTDPTIVASDVDITHNATSGSIAYTIDNVPTPAGTLTANTTASWLTLGTVTSSAVPFTCTANDNVVSRSATVSLTYTYDGNNTVTKDVNVTQGVDPTLGTSTNPYTVAQARTFIDGLGGSTSTEKYVSGIVSQVDGYNSQYSSITYWISDDGTTTNQLQVYSGKGIDGADFSSVNDVEVTAEVVVKGNLKKHNSTYEFDYNNELVIYNGPQHNVEAPTFSPAAGTYATAQTVSMSTTTSGAAIYYTTDGTEPTNASTQYTTALTVSTATTIKAVAYDGTNYSNVTTAIYHINSQANPYTVAQVKDMPAYQLPANGVYVSGIVSQDGTNLSSGALNYYISTDGTTGTELYVFKGKNLNNTDFSATTNIQAGDIVTIYGNIIDYVSGGTTTREFTSGNYLVAYQRPTSNYTLTVGNPTNVTFTVNYDEEVLTNGETADIPNGTEVTFTLNVATGYSLDAITVKDANNDDVTYTVNNGVYSFTMPASNVTINATASQVAPITGDKYVKVTSTTDLTSGQYLVVYEDGSVAFNGGLETLDAVNNTIEVSIINNEIAVNTTTAASEFTIDVTAGTIKSASEYYIGQTSDANGMQTSLETAYTNTISFDDGNANIVSSGGAYLRYNSASNQNRFRYYKSSSYTAQKAIQLYKKVDEPTPVTFTKTITAYTSNDNGWYLIASPVPVTIETNTMVSGTYDLYRFNPTADLEWENYKNSEHSADFTALEVGRGYLYANANDITLSFTGVPASTGEVTAAYTGWNLIGNPLGTPATVDKDYYRMNDTHDGIMTTTGSGNVAVLEGIFVQANAQETVTFTAASKGVRSNEIKSVVLNVMRNNNVIDRAIVRFNSDRQLGKLTLFDGDTKIYIPQNDGDYAIVSSDGQGTMPVNFKAKEIGQYTISVETEGIDLGYLHLIDRLTGDDVNLLLDSKYSFIASSSDMESRFILSFNENGINTNNATFAFQNGSDIIVNGEGELQIFDVMGRMVKNTVINGVETIAMPQGVYVCKLNGNVQKIVVR